MCRISGRCRARYAASRTNATGSTSRAERDRVERHAARLERAREVPGARLVLVQHQHPDVPAALAQPRQQREQVRLGAGDAGDLLEVENASRRHPPCWDSPGSDPASSPSHAVMCRLEHGVGPRADGVGLGDALAQLARRARSRSSAVRRPSASSRSASSRASSRSKRSSSGERACRTPGSTRPPARSSRTPRRRPCPSRPPRMLLTSTSARASSVRHLGRGARRARA